MLSTRIMQLRKQSGMNQKELAKKLHLHEKTVRNWESEESYPSIPNLINLCELFGVTANDLLGFNTSATISLDCLPQEDQQRLSAMIQVYINLSPTSKRRSRE